MVKKTKIKKENSSPHNDKKELKSAKRLPNFFYEYIYQNEQPKLRIPVMGPATKKIKQQFVKKYNYIYKCDYPMEGGTICGKTYASQSALDNHFKDNHLNHKFVCPHCFIIMKSKSRYNHKCSKKEEKRAEILKKIIYEKLQDKVNSICEALNLENYNNNSVENNLDKILIKSISLGKQIKKLERKK